MNRKYLNAQSESEARFQQGCFMWHWNYMPEERGRLLLMHNNPRNAVAGAILRGMGMQEGATDLLYLRKVGAPGGISELFLVTHEGWKGICLPHFLEAKLPEGYQSKAQKEFQKQVEAFGWKYDIFRTLEEFQSLIKNGKVG